jgi:DNA-binding NarL/FixJ family response regulator
VLALPLARRGEAARVRSGDPGDEDRCVRILLADGHDFFRKSIAETLKIGLANAEVVGEARSGPETLSAARRLKPDVVVLDLELPPSGAREIIKGLAEASPASRTVVLSMRGDPGLADQFVRLGAAYVAKSVAPSQLLSAVSGAVRGQRSVVLSVPQGKAEGTKTPLARRLSKRKLEVLRLAACGMSNRQVADTLHICESTVKRHLVNIYSELGVNSRQEAAEVALAEGLLLGT